MKWCKWLLALALYFFLLNCRQDLSPDCVFWAKQQAFFFEKPVDKTKEVRPTKVETQPAISQLNDLHFYVPLLKEIVNFANHGPFFISIQKAPPVCFLKLNILSAKHHPPTS